MVTNDIALERFFKKDEICFRPSFFTAIQFCVKRQQKPSCSWCLGQFLWLNEGLSDGFEKSKFHPFEKIFPMPHCLPWSVTNELKSEFWNVKQMDKKDEICFTQTLQKVPHLVIKTVLNIGNRKAFAAVWHKIVLRK